MFFKEIQGQESLQNTLTQAFEQQHLAHALLFNGREGSANLALALALARYLHCENRQDKDACGKCNSCLKHSKLIHPDLSFIFPVAITKKVDSKPTCQDFLPDFRKIVIKNPYFDLSDWLFFIGADDKQGNIPVEESRQIIQILSMKPFEAEYKLLLIWLPEMMNVGAANALLKILEEPPQKTVFLLVCNSPQSLLPTILSRVQPVVVPDFTENQISDYLQKKLKIATENANAIAYLADGNLSEAIRNIENVDNDNFIWFQQWMRECFRGIYKDLWVRMETFDGFSREIQKYWLECGLDICRETLLIAYGSPENIKVSNLKRDFLVGFAKAAGHIDRITKLSQELSQAIYYIERNANTKMLFFNLSIKIIQVLKG